MTMPKDQELRYPILIQLKNGSNMHYSQLVEPLAKYFHLTEEEVDRMYESGQGPIFQNRIGWAVSHLNIAGYLERPKRGTYCITAAGLAVIKKGDAQEYLTKHSIDRSKHQKKGAIKEPLTHDRPQQQLEDSLDEIKQEVYDQILNTILSKSPRDFENLVVELLQKMGYGGQIENAGTVTQYSNDRGIDGIIKEDILGLGRIHIQAKRYDTNNGVNREEIQKFVGALAVAQSNKGIFITTSYYSKGAKQYVDELNGTTSLVLIDGQKLAQYIYEFDLGMQTEKVIMIKKLDKDFWDQRD